MTAITTAGHQALRSRAKQALKASATLWFLVAVAGQWLFVYYIAGFYGPTAVSGNFETWNARHPVIGYVPGDGLGNLFFLGHVLIAGVLTFGGALQLVPQIRARAITFHRWNGRIFLLAAVAAASGGLYLEWVRGAAFRSNGAGFIEAAAITLDAVLILTFAALAWRAVRRRCIAAHQRWATRLFLVVNGVWFMRIGVAAWLQLTPFSTQSFFTFWSFGAVLLPLCVYELYLRAQKSGAPVQLATAAIIVTLTLIMCVGEASAFVRFWRPFLSP